MTTQNLAKYSDKAFDYRSPPWAATASIFIAFFALGISLSIDAMSRHGEAAWLSISVLAPLVLATVGILGSFLFHTRLEQGRPAVWIVRASAFAAVVLYTMATMERNQSFYYMLFVERMFSLGFVSECVVQHWQRPPSGQQRTAILVFLASIVFVLASRTTNPSYIKYFTPPFIVLLAMSMRTSRPRVERSGSKAWLWTFALACVVVLGSAGAMVVYERSGDFTRILMSLLRPQTYADVPDVNFRPMLRKTFNLPLSQKRVFRIDGELEERHMRGMTFETYTTTGAWASAAEFKTNEDASLALKGRSGGQHLVLTPLMNNLPVLYLPLHMAGVDARSYRITWSSELGGGIPALRLPFSGGSDTYQIGIADGAYKGPLSVPANGISERVRAYCLEIPPDFDPRVLAIAHQLEVGAPTPRDKLEAIRKYLYRNHSYSLSVEPGPGDPVVNFLVQKRDGHCQFFASSAVLLLRCMNVPARYVTGYFAHESPEQGVSIVRQRDAHAWAEVWVDGEGWTTFDATPTGGMPGQSGALAYWSKKWEKLGDLAEAFGAWLRESPLSKIGLITALVVVLGYVINRLLVWRTSARIASSRINYSSAGREFEDLAKTFDALLKRNHATCPSQRPWVDHLEALKHAPQEATQQQIWNKVDAAIRFAREYTTARFGGQSGPETLARLKKQLNDLK